MPEPTDPRDLLLAKITEAAHKYLPKNGENRFYAPDPGAPGFAEAVIEILGLNELNEYEVHVHFKAQRVRVQARSDEEAREWALEELAPKVISTNTLLKSRGTTRGGPAKEKPRVY